MHLHWDNFDDVIARIFRRFLPPLANLLILVYLVWPLITSIEASSGAEGMIQGLAADNALLNDISQALESIGRQAADTLTLAELRAILSATGVALSSAFFSTAIFLLFLLVTVDLATKFVGFLVPFRFVVNEVSLARHHTLQDSFDLLKDKTDQSDPHLVWIYVKNKLDHIDQAPSHRSANKGLIAKLQQNHEYFAYVRAYIVITIVIAPQLSSLPNANLFLHIAIFLGLLGLGAFLRARHQSLSAAIIRNDLESFYGLDQPLPNIPPHPNAQPIRGSAIELGPTTNTTWRDVLDSINGNT